MIKTADEFQKVFEEIKLDPQNQEYTEMGIEPLYYANPKAKILIVGQAPGQKAQDTHMVWNDLSGDRLRTWLDVSRDEFYNSDLFAIMPMDFYFPGKGKGGDLPPRKNFAAKWHPKLRKLMPNIELTILVGSYAVKKYLNLKSSTKLTDIVKDYQTYLPEYFPLVHPSPRNLIWLKKNPWFEEQVVKDLQKLVSEIKNK